MREIKFRAYWNGNEEMIYQDLGRDIYFFEITNDNIIVESYEERHFVEGGEDVIKDVCFDTGSIIMQFTGLKDVNGKDIYEGDIISVDVLVSNPEDVLGGEFDESGFLKKPKEDYVLGVVEFHKGCFMAVMEGDEGEKAGCEIKEDCIVLGNIYEHPELLK